MPLIVTGPGIERGGVSEALVNSTDLFATIMEMAGVDPDEAVPDELTHDSVSFFAALSNPDAPSRREWIYADEFFGGFDGVETADHFLASFYGSDNVSEDQLLEILDTAPDGTSELMCHPAHKDDRLETLSSYVGPRWAELATLTSPRVVAATTNFAT